MSGRLNIYTCDKCHGHIVTRDVDEGTTPFMIDCLSTEGCGGRMVSSMYRVFDQSMRPDYEWYKPSSPDDVDPRVREHVRMGGLLRRKA